MSSLRFAKYSKINASQALDKDKRNSCIIIETTEMQRFKKVQLLKEIMDKVVFNEFGM